MFGSLLIANRGEIAVRVILTARRMGLRTIAVHSEADRGALHVELADEAHPLGPAPAAESYLRPDRILDVARNAGAEAIHPGYGFLSENADFAEACAAAGIVFVGPPPSAIRAMGLKDEAKALMEKAGVPVVPGYHGSRQEPDFLREKAYEIGYPVLVKAVAGGGGKGMRRVDRQIDFDGALEAAQREARGAFGDPRVLIEKYVARPRHIEMQVFADAHGNAVHLFERDCSMQRRHQKVIEEAPAPGMTAVTRAAMGEAAVAAARAVGYTNAGTVEFIVDGTKEPGPDGFHFMEMNTRLQVEHPVTEAVTGLDLVEWQLRVAAGEPLPLKQDEIGISGHAVEARLYAEDPDRGFLPSTGRLEVLELAGGDGIRVDSGVREGDVVTPFYDPMIAKIIAHGASRDEALDRLAQALDESLVAGPRTNLGFLRRLTQDEGFRSGAFDTGLIDARIESLIARPEGAVEAATALGVLRLLERREESAAAPALRATSPWDATDGFQLGPARRMGVRVRVDGVTRSVEVEWDEGEASVVVPEDGPRWAEIDACLIDVPSGVLVVADGRQTHVEPSADAGPDTEALAGDAPVRAPMHGRVVSVDVVDGEAVVKGRKLAVVEAMKMEHALIAPHGGTVGAISVAAGDQVAEGQVMMVVHGAVAADPEG